MKKIRAGVIGVGYLGKFHAQKYAGMEGVELVGVVDVDPDEAAAIAAQYGCAAFTDHRDLLPLVDVVSIVVPTSYHHQVALDCMDAGVDILLEKPITITLAEADDLCARAEAQQLILQVGHLERFNPALQSMQKFLTTPIFIESTRVAPFKNRGVDVDVTLDLMIHDLEIILSLVDSPLQSIHASGASVVTATTDIANARLVFANGATANLTASRVSRSTVRRLRVYQQQAAITVDFASRELNFVHIDPEIGADGSPDMVVETSSFPASDALKEEIIHFIECVRERKKPLVSGWEGRQALAVALQVMAQIRDNQQLPVFQQQSLTGRQK